MSKTMNSSPIKRPRVTLVTSALKRFPFHLCGGARRVSKCVSDISSAPLSLPHSAGSGDGQPGSESGSQPWQQVLKTGD